MSFFADIRKYRPTRPAARWVYVGFDQLRPAHPLLAPIDGSTAPPGADTALVYVETSAKPARRPYHAQKLAMLIAAQRHHALARAAEGHAVVYWFSERWYDGALEDVRETYRVGEMEALAPAEAEVREPLAGLSWLRLHPNPLFITDAAFYRGVFPRPGPRLLETFYRAVRRRTGLLMDGDAPAGGVWNLDRENRRTWKGSPPVPARPPFQHDRVTREAMDLVRTRYPASFGSLGDLDWPVTAEQAEQAASHFMEVLLPHFGPFEDAIDANEPSLFHSLLSAPLNLGLLDPLDLCRRAEARYRLGHAPLASVEGFVRQVLGWREFVRHVYDENRDRYLEANELGARLPLPSWYWGEPSGLNCLDVTVRQVLARGHSHHITRLMVLSNLATLLGIDPHALNQWFWFGYVDAYDWVVTPNVVGMGTYADGGIFATKPYVASGRYVHKMGPTLCAGCRYDPKRTDGPDACPLNHLYWDFLARNRSRLSRNHRMQVPLAQLAKMRDPVLADHRRWAEVWRERAERASPPTG